MDDYKKRLIDERNQLKIRIELLDNFLEKILEDKKQFNFIGVYQLELLQKQHSIMKDYLEILEERIEVEKIEN
ncbi:hypothetical protein KB575_00625 [Streptococcus canis]|uniref:crAss001_48 related protein n=1 Tax=Streptococcus canis TaxID=1329 RepID=UPI0029491F0E|nr:hypothetical protein [Streptococcus canis]MDV5987573.1 hypothetical protein [Streptococcus canis]